MASAAEARRPREVRVLVENLTEQAFHLVGNPGPQAALPALFERTAKLRWTCGAEGLAVAAEYEAVSEAPEEAQSRRLVIALSLPSVKEAPRITGAAAASSALQGFAGKVGGLLGNEPTPASRPSFTAVLRECSGPTSQTDLQRLLAAASQHTSGFAEGCEWLVVEDEDDLLKLHVRLLPPEPPTLAPGLETERAEQDGEAQGVVAEMDDEVATRLKAYRALAAGWETQAEELEALVAAEPLDPAQLRQLPEKARIDLVFAALAIVLSHLRRRLHPAVATDDADQAESEGRLASAGSADEGSPSSMGAASSSGAALEGEARGAPQRAGPVQRAISRTWSSEASNSGGEFKRKVTRALSATAKQVAEAKYTLHGPRDREDEMEVLRQSLAQHAENVFRTLVALVGLDADNTETKIADLARFYLPQPDDPYHELPAAAPQPEEICRSLRRDLGLAAATSLAGESDGGPLQPLPHSAKGGDDAGTKGDSDGGNVAAAAGDSSHGDGAASSPWMWDPGDPDLYCKVGSEARFAGCAWVLEPEVASSVKAAAEGLNQGIILCPRDFCIVYDEPSQGYFVLFRKGRREAAAACLGSSASSSGGSSPPRRSQSMMPAKVPRLWLASWQLLALSIGAGDGLFDARTRATLLELLARFGIPPRLVQRWEAEIGGALFEAMESSQALERSKKQAKTSSAWKIAGAALGGGALLAVTGGLAAPVLATGVMTVGGAVSTVTAGAGALAVPGAIIGGAISTGGLILASFGTAGAAVVFGATGLGLTGWKLTTRWGSLEEFSFEPLVVSKRTVSLAIEISDQAAHKKLEDALRAGGDRLEQDIVVPVAQGGEVAVLAGSCCKEREEVMVPCLPSKGGHAPPPQRAMRLRFEREVDRVQRAVHLAIFITGWLPEEGEFSKPWKDAAREFFPSSGLLALRWESEQLLRLSRCFRDMVKKQIAAEAASFWWKSSAVTAGATAGAVATMAVMWPVWIISYMANLDNAWLVVVSRAQQAGQCLASVLADRHKVGQRPVTLVGHSMGARLILFCLEALHARGEYHVVDDVVLLGTPATTSPVKWRRARAVASGRVVNGYLGSDWFLAFLYRYLEWGISVAGLSKVEVDGVENVNLDGLGIQGHDDYPNHISDILAKCQISERNPVAVIPS